MRVTPSGDVLDDRNLHCPITVGAALKSVQSWREAWTPQGVDDLGGRRSTASPRLAVEDVDNQCPYTKPDQLLT